MKEKQLTSYSVNGFEKVMAFIMLAILVLSLLPLMYVGRYNHPTGDDFFYGAETHLVWEETGSVLQTIGAAMEGVAEQYNRWQGTYSAMFFMYLPPNVFGEEFYRLVTTVILVLLTGSIFYLLKPLVCDFAEGSKSAWVIISSVMSLLCIQTVPSQGETFFWYNGSMYYTGFLAVTFFFWGVICRYLFAPRIGWGILAWILAAFLAGGNYVSLLPCLILLFCLAIMLSYQRRRKETICVIITFTVMLLGFMISAMAPGNEVRQSGMWKISAHIAILKSLLQGLGYTKAWIGVWWILGAMVLLPVFWKNYERKKYRFRYPVIVVGFVYGIFCSMSCPLFYTMNSTGPARAVAIVYYVFILSTFFCYYYMLGYIHSVLSEKKPEVNDWINKKGRNKIPVMLGGVAFLLFIIQISTGAIAQCSTSKAVRLLVTGEAQAYHEEFLARMEVLEDSSIKDVVFEPYVHQPDMLYVGDLPADPEDVTNQKVAKYYYKDSIYINY